MADILECTIGELLQRVATRYPKQEAVVYADRNLKYTYQEFDQLCRQVAKGFMALGVQAHEHISIWATNVPEWLTAQFATAKMGAVLVTVNTSYRTSELEYLLKQSDSKTIVLIESYRGTSYIEMLYEIAPELKECQPGQLQAKELPHLKNVIVIGKNRYPGTYLWSDLLDMSDHITEQELDDRMQQLQPDDVINMQYTSGTTGFPKGVMLTHRNIVNNGRNIAECMDLTQEDRMCIPVPFFHCFGCVLGTMACVTVGATMLPIQEFEVKQVLQTVQQEKCTALHGVPTMFIAELNDPDFANYNLSTLRTGIMAGSPCPIEVMKAVVEKMGAKEITIAYGQTESSPVITQTRTNDPLELRVTTVGKALPNVEVKILQPGTNDEVPIGQQGELCTRGYHVMKGYYKDPDATARVIDAEGWLHTGDLATMDRNGYVNITGRLKDMIIRGGENIYPREIEEFLYTHPKVLDIQVVGVPDEKYGEEVMAWIRVKDGEQITEKEIRDFCMGKIAHFKIPRYIQFCEEYPMTASGKIQKYKLRENALQVLHLQKADSIETA